MNATTASGSLKKGIPYWLQLALTFFVGWIFMYATRNILSASMASIKGEFGLTGVQLGLLNSLFYLSYTLTQIPFGAIGDKIGLKVVLVAGFVLFGVFTGLTGIAASFVVLLIMRIMVGVGQGTYYGPQYALSSMNIPQKHRGIGNAIINSGMAFGTSLGLMGGSYIMTTLGLGWRANFYIFMIPVLLIAVLFQFVIKKRQQNQDQADSVTKSEVVSDAQNVAEPKQGNKRNIVAIFIIVFCSLFGFFFIQSWLPYYLQMERGIEPGSVGSISSLVAWASIPGALTWATLSDKFKFRKPFMIGLLSFALLSMLGAVYLNNITMLIVSLIFYGLTGKLALDPILVSAVADNAPTKNPGTLFSTYNFIGMSASIVAPYVGGFLQDQTGSLSSTFYLAAGFLLIGLVVALFVFKEPRKRTQQVASL